MEEEYEYTLGRSTTYDMYFSLSLSALIIFGPIFYVFFSGNGEVLEGELSFGFLMGMGLLIPVIYLLFKDSFGGRSIGKYFDKKILIDLKTKKPVSFLKGLERNGVALLVIFSPLLITASLESFNLNEFIIGIGFVFSLFGPYLLVFYVKKRIDVCSNTQLMSYRGSKEYLDVPYN